MNDRQTVSMEGGGLTATVSALGAELVQLNTASGLEILWDGNPAVWAGRSPLLFPIVGAVRDDRIAVDGIHYPLLRHGIARTSSFALVESAPSHCTWRLEASEATRRRYPFEFRLDVAYTLGDDGLAIQATVANRGNRAMPCSFGFHPAFRWPLAPGMPRQDHRILFEQDEPDQIRKLQDNLLASASVDSPVVGDRLALSDALFSDDALIFDRLRSRRVSYGADRGPQLDITFSEMPYLGIWSKPGAGFVCIEPWHGLASPEDFDGELAAKPGVISIAPAASRTFQMAVSVRPQV